ncbi:C-mannosyltransferase dpy-19 [Trichostrongylus colubriformis]|uniref:C-mannosyltransferase dpy-19 n=1 Tax=Trichostrongylus colubriformis TaxID=6319 RepID=A0AAN8FGY7_TRICO
MIIAQIAVVTHILRNHHFGLLYSFAMAVFGCLSMLFWQFSQFALFTQVGSLFVVYSFDFIPRRTMETLLKAHLVTFIVAFLLLFGNEMLLTSLYIASILAALILVNLDSILGKITLRPLYVALTSLCFVFGTLGIKLGVSTLLKVEDDAHIFDILRSKFTSYSTFHTRLYTCSKEFDFISFETLQKLYATWLLPAAALGILLFIVVFFLTERKELMYRSDEKGKPYAEIFYNIVQAVCYAVMALLIMRLKLFFTPHLCICAALLANTKLLHAININLDKRIHAVFVIALIAGMAYEGKSNIEKQLSISGEYSNPEQEYLFEWIMTETKPDAVFAGTMPVMANVKLTTLRPIANHPHYEDVGIRNRTKLLYSMFSRKPIHELHETLKQLGVNYFVFQLFNCAPDAEREFLFRIHTHGTIYFQAI